MKSFLLLSVIIATACATVVVDQTLDIEMTSQTETGPQVTTMKGVKISTEGYRFIGPLEITTQTFWLQFHLDDLLKQLGIGSAEGHTFQVLNGTVVVFQDYGPVWGTRNATYGGVKPIVFQLPSFNEKSSRFIKGYERLQMAIDYDVTSWPSYDVLKPSNNNGGTQPNSNRDSSNWIKYVYIYYHYATYNEVLKHSK